MAWLQGRKGESFLSTARDRMLRGFKEMARSRMQRGGRFPKRRRRRLYRGGRFKPILKKTWGGRTRLKVRGSFF